MRLLQTEFESSCKDLEKAQLFNETVNTKFKECQAQAKLLHDEKLALLDSLSSKEAQHSNLLQEIDLREDEKEKIIDHIKKQAENAVVFYKNKYERMIRESH
jgi:hypothetical protein